MEVYFSSDWHLGHRKILKFANRPFETVEEMDTCLMDNYCSIVKPKDEFYFLGDFCFSPEAFKFWNKLPGKKTFIAGNHDGDLRNRIQMFSILNKKFNNVFITMCHFPMVSWDKSHYGAISLHGHHHSLDVNNMLPGKRINVCCDFWDFKPISLDQIIEETKSLPDNWDLIRKGTVE